MNYTTPFLYAQYADSSWAALSADADNLEYQIETATAYISEFLNRLLYITSNVEEHVVNGGLIALNEYPLNKVKWCAAGTENAIQFDIDTSVLYAANIETDLSGLYIESFTFDGDETSYEFNYTDYPNTELLSNEISGTVSGMTPTLINKVPCKFIVPQNLVFDDSITTEYLNSIGTFVKTEVDYTTNSIVQVYQKSGTFVWCEYTAGYITPTDNVDHTGLDVVGNLPKIITLAANKIISILRDPNYATGANSLLVSENLGDYGYTRQVTDGKLKDNIVTLLEGMEGLDIYRRKVL